MDVGMDDGMDHGMEGWLGWRDGSGTLCRSGGMLCTCSSLPRFHINNRLYMRDQEMSFLCPFIAVSLTRKGNFWCHGRAGGPVGAAPPMLPAFYNSACMSFL